ncbi:MAG: LytTR family DNA-binding domain-containing protein [Coriobacteriales bacterium]|nr:LytTR family DNA-binding domain-containing protein [Coriobacteriales bacterium]
MNSLNIAVCEDEQQEYERLSAALEAIPFETSTKWFAQGQELLEALATEHFDLIFLDIVMQPMSGVEVAARIREINDDIPLAFVTTSTDYALEGYRYHVDRYIQKPYRTQDIEEFIGFAQRKLESMPGVMVRGNKIPYTRIRYVEQRNHTSVLHLIDGSELGFTAKLDVLERELPAPPFFRCHKSYLANLDYVKWLNREFNMFEMIGGGNVYIRRASLGAANRAMNERLIDKTRRMGI